MRFALCGAWHVHAAEYVTKALEFGEVIGVWEENEKLRENICKKFSLPSFDTLDELLASDADGVIVCSASCDHAEHMVKIANAKKDIFTEKVLCLTTEDCLKVKEAVENNGVRFVISLFQKFKGYSLAIKEIVDSGELGKINYIRFTNCHSGSTANWLPRHFYDRKECGGGAMIDLGAHGMYLIHWLTGKLPVRYASTFTVAHENERNVDAVEDNAVTVMTFDDGCIAVNETGFVTSNRPIGFEVSGENGTVSLVGSTITKRVGKEKILVEIPADLPRPIEAFVKGETPAGCGLEEAIALTAMMEGAYQNA